MALSYILFDGFRVYLQYGNIYCYISLIDFLLWYDQYLSSFKICMEYRIFIINFANIYQILDIYWFNQSQLWNSVSNNRFSSIFNNSLIYSTFLYYCTMLNIESSWIVWLNSTLSLVYEDGTITQYHKC